MPLGVEVGLSPGDFVLDGDPAPSLKRGGASQFSAHVCCGQTAAWIKMPLGTEVDLGQGHIVLDGVPAVRERGTAPPSFRPCLLWPRSPISATAELLFYIPVYYTAFIVNYNGVSSGMPGHVLSPKNCPFAYRIRRSGQHLIWFTEPTSAHNPNGISIGSAIFAKLTVGCPYTLQRAILFSQKTAPSHGESGAPYSKCFTGQTRVQNPNGIWIDSAIFAQFLAECPYTNPIGDLHPRLIYDSFGRPESTIQIVCRSVQPSLQGSRLRQTDGPTNGLQQSAASTYLLL